VSTKAQAIANTVGQCFLTFFTYLTPFYQTRLPDLPQYIQWSGAHFVKIWN